jgi:hypothetical protein
MKNYWKAILVFLLSFSVSSCLEYQFSTRINPDGSCERTMIVRGDSSNLMNGIIPVPTDSVWKISIGKVQGESRKFELTAVGKFKSIEELNKYFYKSPDSMPTVSIKAELKKKFRWFYTYLDYHETYYAFTPYRKVPIGKFLKEDEIKILFAENDKIIYSPKDDILRLRKDTTEKVILSRADSLKMTKKKEDLENRYNAWFGESLLNEVYTILATRAGKLNDPSISEEMVIRAKDSVFNELKRTHKYIMSDESRAIALVADDILAAAKKYFPSDLLNKTKDLDSAAYRAIDYRHEKMNAVTTCTYGNEVQMPGVIIAANAKSMKGNTLCWDIEPGEFFFYDFVMSAESRIMNRWSFWVTGVLAVLLLSGLIAGSFGRKHH